MTRCYCNVRANKKGVAMATPLPSKLLAAMLDYLPLFWAVRMHRVQTFNAHQLVADQKTLSLHIGTKVTVGPPLRVADIMSETLRLSANVTHASHDWLHFCVQNEIGPGGRGRHENGTLEGVRNHAVYDRQQRPCQQIEPDILLLSNVVHLFDRTFRSSDYSC